jgi:hypothetical protein
MSLGYESFTSDSLVNGEQVIIYMDGFAAWICGTLRNLPSTGQNFRHVLFPHIGIWIRGSIMVACQRLGQLTRHCRALGKIIETTCDDALMPAVSTAPSVFNSTWRRANSVPYLRDDGDGYRGLALSGLCIPVKVRRYLRTELTSMIPVCASMPCMQPPVCYSTDYDNTKPQRDGRPDSHLLAAYLGTDVRRQDKSDQPAPGEYPLQKEVAAWTAPTAGPGGPLTLLPGSAGHGLGRNKQVLDRTCPTFRNLSLVGAGANDGARLDRI